MNTKKTSNINKFLAGFLSTTVALASFGIAYMFIPVVSVSTNGATIESSGGVYVASAAKKRAASKKPKPSSKPKSKGKASNGKKGVPKGGQWRPNSYGKSSLSGKCKKIGKKCVTFSKSGCGNFYIKGYHFGGSKQCAVLGIHCGGKKKKKTEKHGCTTCGSGTTPAPTPQPMPIQAEQCQTDECEEQFEFEPVIDNVTVSPALVEPGQKCNIKWDLGGGLGYEDEGGNWVETVPIVCTIKRSGGTTTPVASSESEGYPVSPGTYTLTCTRGAEVETETVACKEKPNFQEF